MGITSELVEYIEKLAKLEFAEEEKAKLSKELSRILEYVEKLNELNTNDVEPLSHTTEMTNVFREDEVRPSLPAEVAVKHASSSRDTFFEVPKVIK